MEHGERQDTGVVAKLVSVVAITWSAYAILYVWGVFEYFGVYIAAIPHRSLNLAFLTVLVFLLCPLRKKQSKSRLWYDIPLLLMGIAGPVYNFLFWLKDSHRLSLGEFTVIELVLAILTVVVLLETTRRVIGLGLPVVAAFFLFQMFFSQYLPGFLGGRGISLSRAAALLIYSDQGVYGVAMGVASTVVIMFIIFGQFLFVSPMGTFFTDLAVALLGYVRGGPAKVSVVGSALFGTMSASVSANIVTIGSFTIPLMKRIGYKPDFAGAVEAVASTGGHIMPPVMASAAFVMAEWLGISYWDVCVAAFIPASLYYLALFWQVDAEAAKNGLTGLPRSQCPPIGKTLRQGWLSLVPLVVLLVFLGAKI